MYDFTSTWLDLLDDIICSGMVTYPRGKNCLELPQATIKVDMRRPVLQSPKRKLSYKFMAAEAYWILTGEDRVSTIAPYNKAIEQFSDNGLTFFGAYGPKISNQLSYVVNSLKQDPETRQAGLTIWRENPPKTKDLPCTISMFFMIRRELLNAYVFMRSSDVWLGIPYDVFNFSMITHLVCAMYADKSISKYLMPGTLYLTAASSHLYDTDIIAAKECIQAGIPQQEQPRTPVQLAINLDELLERLRLLRDAERGSELRWWEVKNED